MKLPIEFNGVDLGTQECFMLLVKHRRGWHQGIVGLVNFGSGESGLLIRNFGEQGRFKLYAPGTPAIPAAWAQHPNWVAYMQRGPQR